MNKQQFLDELERSLRSLKIQDGEEVMTEYRQHFEFKLADGYSEEEISAVLGDPKEVARQFVNENEHDRTNAGKNLIIKTGLIFGDIFVSMFFIMLFAWVIVLGAAAFSFLVIGILLLFKLNISGIIPSMPYINSLLHSIPVLLLSVISAVGTFYCFLYSKQLMKAYLRWHSNMLAAASQKPLYPSLAKYPQLSGVTKRRIRNILLSSLVVFGITFIIAFIASAINAGSVEFWHVWNWFRN